MSRFAMRSPSRWIMAMLVIAVSLPVVPAPIAADEIVLLGPPLVRKFPAFDFCPFPVEMEFMASGSTAKIFVSANTYVFQDSITYTHQGIDDIVVVRDSVYALHLAPNDGSFSSCYSDGQTVPFIFKFDEVNPSDAPYYELFETSATGWDLANGAYYETGRSGPMTPSTGSSSGGSGCLGLGVRNGSPALTDTARTVVDIHGLIGGKRYNLTGWWSVDNGIASGNVSMTIKITGPDLVPLAQKTWGAVKARYR